MRESVKVGEEEDVVYVGRSKSRKPCHLLMRLTGVGAQKAEEPCVEADRYPLSGLFMAN